MAGLWRDCDGYVFGIKNSRAMLLTRDVYGRTDPAEVLCPENGYDKLIS